MISYGFSSEVKIVRFAEKRMRDEDDDDIIDYWMNRAKVAENKLVVLEPIIQKHCEAYLALKNAFDISHDTHNYMHSEIERMMR
jgi:hypothetical protein